jgi:predicted nucleic-acid-binding protein
VKKTNISLPDTNVIVRYLVDDEHSLFARAKTFFDKIKQGSEKAILLESVLAECIYVLTKIYRVPRDEAASILIDLLQYKGIANTDKNELVCALRLYMDKHIDIVDAILCAKAHNGGHQMITFDKELQKIFVAGEHVR